MGAIETMRRNRLIKSADFPNRFLLPPHSCVAPLGKQRRLKNYERTFPHSGYPKQNL